MLDVSKGFAEHVWTRRRVVKLPRNAIVRMLKVRYGIDWHQTVLAKIETGERAVKLTEAYALADIYDIPLDDLVWGIDLDRESPWKRDEDERQ